jgi:hypothetical protein
MPTTKLTNQTNAAHASLVERRVEESEARDAHQAALEATLALQTRRPKDMDRAAAALAADLTKEDENDA